MSITELASWVDDRSLYPIHEEDDVPEIPRHEREVRHLLDVLDFHFPERFVTGNACIYWIPGDFQFYYAPDVFVADGAPAVPEPRVYHICQDPPIVFAAEVVLHSLTEAQREHNFRICERVLCIPELLEFDAETSLLRLWRLGADGYESVMPEPNGRLRSLELELEFGLDAEGWLRAYTWDGELLRIYEEAERDREAAEARADDETRLRAAAEARAEEEVRQREAAESRAAEEARQREALEREVAALRAALERQANHAGGNAPEQEK